MTGIGTTRIGRPRTVGALLLGVMLTTAACSGSRTPATSSTGGGGGNSSGSFTVAALKGLVVHLTPGQSGNSFIDTALFTPLMQIDPKTGDVGLGVADKVSSSDQMNWTITLKQGWTFHDGTPVTAQSFADSWNATAYGPNGWIGNTQFNIIKGYPELNPASGSPSKKTLSGVQVVDDKTLKVTLTSPNSLFPYVLASTTWAPMPKAATTDPKGFDIKPIGNGPFKIEGAGNATGAQSITLVRNDAYTGTKAVAKKVDIKLFQDANTAYTSFKGGAVDVDLVDGTNLADARTSYKSQLVDVSYPAVVFLGFPSWDKRYADPNVRKAIALSIDRKTIASALLRGSAEPANSLGPESVKGASGITCDSCTYDPAQAKSLLSGSGFTGKINLWTTDDPAQGQVLKAIGNELSQKLGVSEVGTNSQSIAQIYTNLAQKKIDGPFLLYTGVTIPHVWSLTTNLFTPSLFNVTGYQNKQVSADLAASAAASSPEQIVADAQKAATQGLADLSMTPVYFPLGGLVHAKKVNGVTPTVLGGPALATISVGS